MVNLLHEQIEMTVLNGVIKKETQLIFMQL